MEKYQDELIGEFVIESKEHLSSIEEDFLLIEKHCDNPDKNLIDKVFRAIHSIKGAAGFLGLKNINDLSHVMETLLHMIRSGECKAESKYVDAMLAGVDYLNIMFDDIADCDSVDISKVRDRISSLIAKKLSPKINSEMHTSVSLKSIGGISLDFEVSEYAIKTRPQHHNFLYLLKYDLNEMRRKGSISPVKLVNELLSMGEILQAKISTPAKCLSEDLSAHPLSYEVLYSTVLDPDLVKDAAQLPEDKIIQIKTDTLTSALPIETARAPVEKVPTKTEMPVKAEVHEKTEITSEAPVKAGVEHETVRISVEILDRLMTLAGELVLVRNQHLITMSDRSDPVARGISQRLDIVTSELQEMIMRTRMQPIGNVFGKLPRIARDLSQKLGKQIEMTIMGEDVELDKTILESIGDPLTHIIRNSCDHGIETPDVRIAAGKRGVGNVTVKAYHEGGQINIEISDDGKGIDPERIKAKCLEKGLKTREELSQMTEKDIISLVLLPGFSTSETVSEVSGRGVGMDVVHIAIENLGGILDISSKTGEGTTILLRLPLTLAIIPCLIVMVGEYRYAIPQVNLEELVCLYDSDVRTKIETDNNQEVYRLRNRLLPMVRLAEVIATPKVFTCQVKGTITEKHRQLYAEKLAKGEFRDSLNFAVVRVGANRFGLIIDKVLGVEEIVVKPVHSALKSLKIYSGATVMGDGRCAMILDIDGLANHTGLEFADISDADAASDSRRKADETQAVLLFKSGDKEQFAVALSLVKRIEKIKMSEIEEIGEKEFITIDDVPTRIVRLDKAFNVSECKTLDEMFLLLPKHIKNPFGVLISSLVDIAESPMNLNVNTHKEDGILGTAIVRDRLTMYPDIYKVIEKLEPDWFNERKTDNPPPKDTKKILLAEDACFFRQLVTNYLETDGYSVTSAVNGKEALEIYKENPFDLIISDIEMPEMNGFDFMKSVRALPERNNVPSIALTALDSDADKEHAESVGFNCYEVKIDREALLKSVARFFSK